MPFFPLGRLFWKFLVFFFLAQATAVLGFGLAIWATTRPGQVEARTEMAVQPPPPAFAPPGADGRLEGPPPLPEARMAGPDQDGPPLLPRGPEINGPKPPLVHLAAGAVVSLIFAALLAAYVARPIRRLRLALREAAEGRLTPGLAQAMGDRHDELADLGHEFDRMARHLEQLMQGQRHLLHDVSHELRSPLARLTAIIGIARQQPEKFNDCLTRLEAESTRMDRLLAELLTLSRLESGMTEYVAEEVDVDEILVAVVSDAEPEAERADCTVDYRVATEELPLLVHGDAEMLHRVFNNLVRNALSYAAEGHLVSLARSCDERNVVVKVEDRGPGVRPADLERVFEPFFRGAQAAGKTGHGLGLAIARRIVEKHGGKISVSNREYTDGGGLCVSVELPRAVSPIPTSRD